MAWELSILMGWAAAPASLNQSTRWEASPKRDDWCWNGLMESGGQFCQSSGSHLYENYRLFLDISSALDAFLLPASRNHCKERCDECDIQWNHEHNDTWKLQACLGYWARLTWAFLLQISLILLIVSSEEVKHFSFPSLLVLKSLITYLLNFS